MVSILQVLLKKKIANWLKSGIKKKGMELFARSKFGVKLIVCDFNSEQQKNEATMNMFADAYIISKHWNTTPNYF